MSNILAIFRRELAGSFGQPLAWIVLVVFVALVAVATLVVDDVFASGVADMRRPFLWIAACFVFLVPAVTMRLLADEWRSGGLELLVTLPITSAEIVLGKWLSAVALVAVALALTFSWPLALAAGGELDWGPVIGGYLGLLLVGAAYAAIGTFASAITSYQVVAFLIAFAACVAPWVLWFVLGFVPGDAVPLLQYLTFGYHYTNLARGVLDTRSLVFYAGVMLVGLRSAILVLEHREAVLTRRQLLGHAWAQTGLWAAIALFANHAASAVFLRADLTNDREFTLQPASREVMDRLDKPLVARMYFTRGLESPYSDYPTAVRDKLEELAAFSHGQLVVEEVDPDTAAEIEEAQRFGLEPITYRFRSKARSELKQVFMGVSLVQGDRQEVVDAISTLDTLEYDLVRAIHAVSTKADDRKTVGVLQGDGEPDLWQYPSDNPLGALRDSLGKVYELRPVTLGADQGVPEAVDAMLVIGPQQALPDRTLYQLDQFVMRGGSLALFVGNTRPDFDTMRLADVRHELDAWLGHLGVRLRHDLVVDRKNDDVMQVPVAAGKKRVLVPLNYPLIPISTAVDHASPITRGLDRVVMPFVSTLEIGQLADGTESAPLVTTLETATAVDGLRTLRPDVLGSPLPNERTGPFLVAAAVHGRFTSFFADKPIPAAGDGPADDPSSKIVDGDEARLVVVGSADFVANNLTFVMNAMDWLVADPSLIAIRSRTVDVDRLTIDEAAIPRWKAAVAGVPLLLVALGGAVTALLARRG